MSSVDSVGGNRRKVIAVHVPETPQGNFIQFAVDYLSAKEDRSVSKTVFLMMKNYFEEHAPDDLMEEMEHVFGFTFDGDPVNPNE